MLEANERTTLLESLRPPEGYDLDRAIGTTFTLDLLAALTTPVGFTLLELQAPGKDSSPPTDRLTLLHTIRDYADRILIFCQAGEIAVPRKQQMLFSYLEDSIVQVTAARPEGVFHTKMWLLRFRPLDSTLPVLYRLIVPSRNLTFDRSWDTLVILDGTLRPERQRGFSENRALETFLRSLRGLSVGPLSDRLGAALDSMVSDIRKIEWAVPLGFDGVRFWPLGIDGATAWPFGGRIDRFLVMSPFLTEGFFRRMVRKIGTPAILISQQEELQRFGPEALQCFDTVYSITDGARYTGSSETDVEPRDGCGGGLHAKLYVADAGRDASVWTGSANATDAGFGLNVELLVELVGAKKNCGIDALLQSDGDYPFRALLADYHPGPPVRDEVGEALQKAIDKLQRQIAGVSWRMTVAPHEDELFALVLDGGPASIEVPVEAGIRCWPITARERAARIPTFGAPEVARFERLSLEAITAFLGFEVSLTRGDKSLVKSFVLRAELVGAPSDRRERILAALLADRDDFLRLLLLLLNGGESAVLLPVDSGSNGAGGNGHWGQSTPALLESLLRAIDRDPSRLDHLAALIGDLQRTPDGARVIPPDLDQLWKVVWETRELVRHEA